MQAEGMQKKTFETLDFKGKKGVVVFFEGVFKY